MTEPTYTFTPGSTPLLISVPHGGTVIPQTLRDRYTPDALTVPDTDWHVPLLYQFALARGAGLLAATHSRYVIDLNRNPDGAVLYVGADNTELCPTKSFAQAPLYRAGCEPDAAEVARRREQYWQPYHEQLAAELALLKQQHGHAILLDGHSIRAEVPRFFEGRLPDLNLGTADGSSCSAPVQQAAEAVLSKADGFSFIANGRFKGGTITRRYGQPQKGVHALQLEMAQACYMDEAPPYAWSSPRSANLIPVLKKLVDAMLALPSASLMPSSRKGHSMIVTPLYAGLLALWYLALSLRVIQKRNTISLGDGGDAELLRRIRGHGNFAEYVPLILLMLGFMEVSHFSLYLIHALGITLLVSRLLHGVALSYSAQFKFGRFWGALLTLLILLVTAVCCIYQGVLGLQLQ